MANMPVSTALSSGATNIIEGEWPDRRLTLVSRAELWSYTATAPRAQALIYAGGGYTSLFIDKEGVEVALWLNSLGIDAHVLVHRLPGQPDGKGGVQPKDIALVDSLAALRHLPTTLPLFHVGLSSGGHMAGVMACQTTGTDVRGAIIAYAPLNANHRRHKYPEGKPDYPPVEKQDFYDDWPIGLSGHPHAIPKMPVFLAYALADASVPIQHALSFIETAAAQKLDVDAHIFGLAPHGFALRSTTGSEASWPTLAADWIERHL
ncbi:alpha/beta hydrolase family protein [Pleomorphomonas oryzae]|uniref:alpha/beta hydrolase family protein n=1 Tax=Pleomorphomonas oryzae TaxID=261934 RepID=UPI00042A4996|nr:prolyl oligopeptidase family serine peptidase [Pleomorphomonas oryzae]